MTFATVELFEIGATYAGRVNVETLTAVKPCMSPKATYQAYTESVPVGGGGRKSRGAPIILWDWGIMYADMFTALRAICPGASAAVYIRSRLENSAPSTAGSYSYYSANMIWPDLESYEYRSGFYQPFQLRFENPVVYTP